MVATLIIWNFLKVIGSNNLALRDYRGLQSMKCPNVLILLLFTLSWWRFLSYRNQSFDLMCTLFKCTLFCVLTAKNAVTSPEFLVWKFCGKAQFPRSFGWFARNYAETVPFRKISTPENQMKLQYFLQWLYHNQVHFPYWSMDTGLKFY